MGKGSRQRPRLVSYDQWSLNYDLAHERISRKEYDRAVAKLKGTDENGKWPRFGITVPFVER